MKKTLAILMALVMVLGACTFASAEVKTYKVGISIYQYTDNFMTLYRNEIDAYFKTLETDEVKYELVFADAKNDMAEQTNQMNNFVTQGMDVIILNPVQTSSADVLIDIAVSNEIPLVLINREPLAYDVGFPFILQNKNKIVLPNLKKVYMVEIDCFIFAVKQMKDVFRGGNYERI